MSYEVKRLRIQEELAEWLRAYAAAKGISMNRAVNNLIDNEKRRTQHRRLRSPV